MKVCGITGELKMPDCPNLRELFGDKHHVRLSTEFKQLAGVGGIEKPWFYELLCQKQSGCRIVPWGPDRLAVIRDKPAHSGVFQELMHLKTTRLEQDGDDGQNISFHLDEMPSVLRIVRPRHRKKLSDEQRQVLAERLQKVRP